MKKKVICTLVFALFLMVACTMLSVKIEDEMLTQVVVRDIAPQPPGRFSISLPFSYLYFEDETFHLKALDVRVDTDFTGCELYQVEEGSGWEDGLRMQLVSEEDYWPDVAGGALMGPDETRGWMFVDYASRRPHPGQKVEILDTKEKARERYLMIYPERIPKINWKLEEMSIITQTENILLLEMKNARQPFIRERAVEENLDLYLPHCKIYCVETVEQFLQNLPAVVGVAVLFFAALVLWIQSMFLLKDHWENRWLLTANFVFGLGLLWGLWYLLGQIDLPSDLLPAENIFQWSHYSGEFSQIMSALDETRGSLFDSMKHLGRTGQNTINLAFRINAQIKCITVAGVCVPVMWVSAPAIVRKVYKNWTAKNGNTERNII